MAISLKNWRLAGPMGPIRSDLRPPCLHVAQRVRACGEATRRERTQQARTGATDPSEWEVVCAISHLHGPWLQLSITSRGVRPAGRADTNRLSDIISPTPYS